MVDKRIWALTDGRPGNDNQTIAVAGELGLFTVMRISYTSLAKLPNCLLGTSTIGISTDLHEPYPDIVISAGRKLARVARIIKKRSNAKIIQLMWPGYGANDFDLIFTPEHDRRKPQPNLIETIGSPNRVTKQMLNIESEKWRTRIPKDHNKTVTVLVGSITDDEAKTLATHINKLSAYPLITTSRRTSESTIAILKDRISRERYLYEWKPDSDNPYYAFLGLADFIICTGDSISMMAESCSTGKPVYIFPCDVPEKHEFFASSLVDSGRARLLGSDELLNFEYKPLNTLDFIKTQISERI